MRAPDDPMQAGALEPSRPLEIAAATSDRAPRVLSLDAFRGLSIAGMILVNNPGSWDHVYPLLLHAEWFGVTPTDLVFPFFLFAVGVSIPISFGARAERGMGRGTLWAHVLRRSLVIYGLGLAMALVPDFDWPNVRLVGVLARIALVYLVAATLVLFVSRRVLFALTVSALIVYWGLMSMVPTPGFEAGDLSPEGNLASYLDRILLGPHMWRGGGGVFDPEGLLSTLPALSNSLAGVFVGDLLRGDRDGSRTVRPLITLGPLLIVLGWVWGGWFPLSKNLWTSSYVVYTTGWAMLFLALLYWSIDVRGWKRWAMPLVVYGMNAITVFVASGLVAKTLIRWQVDGAVAGQRTSMYQRAYEVGFASWAGPINGSLAFAVATVLIWWACMWWLHRKRIFLKV